MDYRNPEDCLHALKGLHPLNTDETCETLVHMLATLAEAPPPAAQYLAVLEAMRSPMAAVQDAYAHEYSRTPLAPLSEKNGVLLRVVRNWQSLSHGYANVMRRDAAVGNLDHQRALLAQRRVLYAGLALFEYYRAHREVPQNLWAELHDSYARAEAQGVGRARVPDELNEVWRAQSPLEAYAAMLLVDIANPFGRSGQQLLWVYRWAQRFAPYCTLHDRGITPETGASGAYGLLQQSSQGLRPLETIPPTSEVRLFDSSRLADQIQAVLMQFKKGIKPAALGLGADCRTEVSARLLLSLYRPWGRGVSGRRYPRRLRNAPIEIATQWETIGFHISGKRFQPPPLKGARKSASDITTLTFGGQVERVTPINQERQRLEEARAFGLVTHNWDVVDESMGGLRVRSRLNDPEEGLGFHQLVAMRPHDSRFFLLGKISWLMCRENGSFEAGVEIMNGVAEVIPARHYSRSGHETQFEQAFSLPEVPSLKKSATFVLPAGWFQVHRTIEVVEGKQYVQYRLLKALVRGANFDQVTYERYTPEI